MAAKYKVVIADFADTTTFGPGAPIAILSDATNIGWSEYINDVSEAFFSLSQEDPQIANLGQAVNYGKHCLIYRNGTLVWAGWLGEADETLNDVVFTAYSYISGFYTSILPWEQEWTGANASTIIEESFDFAKAATKSRVGWLTKGTIQTIWEESGGPTTLTIPYYRAPYKRVLSVFREMAAYAISDTTNRVKVMVHPNGEFRVYRDDQTQLADIRWRLGDGKVRSYRRIRLPVDRRNEILAVGASPRDTILRHTITKTANRDAAGLKQEPIFLSWVRGSGELTRIAKIRANRALRIDTDLYLSFFKDTVEPFRSASQDYAIGDTVTVSLKRGLTNLTGLSTEKKIVVGQQVLFARGNEYVRVLLQDDLS